MFTVSTQDGTAMINGLGQVKVFSTEFEARIAIKNTPFENLRVVEVHLVK
jgi:hypothetical protein